MIVYTCVAGSYDRLEAISPPLEPAPVCFSDSITQAPQPWVLRGLVSPAELTDGHEINRYHKLFAARVLPDCDYSVYQDGNISYSGDYSSLIKRVRYSGAALGVFQHPSKRNLHAEVAACRQHGRFNARDLRVVDKQMSFYAEEGFDLRAPISANYLIVRDHRHPDLAAAMTLWWTQLQEFTRRDQLSLNYVLWKTGLPWVFLDAPELNAQFGEPVLPVRRPHRQGRWMARFARFRWSLRSRS